MSDRYGGFSPCRWTVCGECEGMGVDDPHQEGRCGVCCGTGRRVGQPWARLMEFVYGFYEPFHFAWFWVCEYGFMPKNGDGGAVGAFLLTWAENRHHRKLFARRP